MNKVLGKVKNYALSVLAPVIMIALLLLISPETRSLDAVLSLLRQGFIPTVIGWGVLFNMKVGNWDFSIGARFVLAAILAGNLAQSLNLGVFGLVLFSLVLSLVFGVIVGLVYKFLKIPTLIASIGLALIFESLTRIVYGGGGAHISSDMMILSTPPFDFILFVICFALAAFFYYKRRIGYSIRAVGSNPTVAQTNGISALNTKTAALILSGLFAGLYTVFALSKSGVASAVSGTLGSASTVFDAMMCVLIGMAICGKGNIIFSIYGGAIITQILKMGMVAIGLPTTYNKVVIAVFVIFFMVLSSKSAAIERFFARFKGKRKTA